MKSAKHMKKHGSPLDKVSLQAGDMISGDLELGLPRISNIYSPSNFHQSFRNINCHSASITRPHRLVYARNYPTVVVFPDGSSINIRYHEPRKIITLPVDLAALTEEERRLRLEKRKPKKKVKIEEDISDDFDVNKYVKYIKKK